MRNAVRSWTLQTIAGRNGAWRWLSSVVRVLRRGRGATFERLEREEKKIRTRITNFDGSDRLARDVLYDRK